jgi:hypothetical protein
MSIKLKGNFALQILVISVVFILALAFLDFSVCHMGQGPEAVYKYWISLTFIVVVFGFALAYGYWMGATKKISNPYIVPGIFFTIVLLYAAGFLDIFYFLLTRKYGESYSFETWSAQYKWFGFWNWSLQVIWSTFFIFLIVLMWYMIIKHKKSSGMIRRS